MSPPGDGKGRPGSGDGLAANAHTPDSQRITRASDNRRKRRAALYALLEGARRHGNAAAEKLAVALLDDEYVSRAHIRAIDPEIVRLRRSFREAA